MNYQLTNVFVSPVSNSLPTTGTTANLTANQLGVYLPNLTPATSGNAAAAEYLRIVQQRPNSDLNLPTIKSDAIADNKVIKKYKVVGSTGQVQVGQLTDFDVKCDEDLTVTLRVWEDDTLMSFADGLTKTFVKRTPCCECDGDPCASIEPSDLEDLIKEIADDINADPLLNTLLVASTTGSGASIILVLTGLAQVEQQSADLTVNNYRPNAVSFKAWAHRNAHTTQDIIKYWGCDAIGTYTETQSIEYPKGTSDQVKLIEYKHFSYTIPKFKERFSDVNYNGIFHSNVADATLYDTFVIEFNHMESPNTWSVAVNQDSAVVVFVPQAQTSAFEAILTAKYGAFTSI